MKNFPECPPVEAHTLPDIYLTDQDDQNLYHAVHIFQQPTFCIYKHIMDILPSQSTEAKFNHFNGCLVFSGMDVP